MADGRAAGLVNLAFDEPEDELEKTIVGFDDDDDDDGDPTAVTAVHSLQAYASQTSEADAEDPTYTERPAANDTLPPVQRSDVRALAPRLGPPRPATLIPPTSHASKLLSQPPEPMLFTPSAMPPPMPPPAPTGFASTIMGQPAPQMNYVPPPMESSVVPLSSLEQTFDDAADRLLEQYEMGRAPTVATPAIGTPAAHAPHTAPVPVQQAPIPTPSPSRVEGLLFMPPRVGGSVIIPANEIHVQAEPPRAPPRPPSPSYDDLRDLVGKRETDLAHRPNTVPIPPPPPSVRAPLHAMPPPPPRPSALGLEVYLELEPGDVALESVLPPAPPVADIPSDHAIPIPLGQPSQAMIPTVRPINGSGNVIVTFVFFVGYVFRAGFGRIVDASAAMGELGREMYEAMRAEWHRAERRSTTRR